MAGRGAFRTQSNIYDGASLRKQLTGFNCYFFSQKTFIIDVWLSSKYATSGVGFCQPTQLNFTNNNKQRFYYHYIIKGNIFNNRPSKMCGREPLKTLKAVFDNIYVVNSSIHCLVHPSHKSRNLSHLVIRILSGNKRRFMLLFEKQVAY